MHLASFFECFCIVFSKSQIVLLEESIDKPNIEIAFQDCIFIRAVQVENTLWNTKEHQIGSQDQHEGVAVPQSFFDELDVVGSVAEQT